MRSLLLPVAILLVPVIGSACSCVQPTGTPCTSLEVTPLVFVGRVIRDSGAGIGKGPARMVVEEILRGGGLLEGAELEINTMAMTSCYMRLEKGERYVIFGSRDEKVANLIENHICAHSFRVRGNEAILNALRRTGEGGITHLLGSVYKKKDQYGLGDSADAGIRVVARQNEQQLETLTTARGQFDFTGIAAGTWQLRVESPGMAHSSAFPIDPVEVPAHGCGIQYLSAASDGRIRGIVRGTDGRPVAGVNVQVFAIDERGKLEISKFQEAVTGSDGGYEIAALPSRQYVVGINGEKYHDRAAYPPLFYPHVTNRDKAQRISLGEMQQIGDIDFTVSVRPTPVRVRIDWLPNEPE